MTSAFRSNIFVERLKVFNKWAAFVLLRRADTRLPPRICLDDTRYILRRIQRIAVETSRIKHRPLIPRPRSIAILKHHPTRLKPPIRTDEQRVPRPRDVAVLYPCLGAALNVNPALDVVGEIAVV